MAERDSPEHVRGGVQASTLVRTRGARSITTGIRTTVEFWFLCGGGGGGGQGGGGGRGGGRC